MKLKILLPKLSLLYENAKKSFNECILNKDNDFLRDEINIPIEDIILIEKDIKFVFSQKFFDRYIIEVCLLLFAENKEIGKYLYFENENNEGIDDSLVFY
jgi:hypothetical protein